MTTLFKITAFIIPMMCASNILAQCDITSVSLQNVGTCNENSTSDPTDDFFTANVMVSFINTPATGALQIEPGGDAITTHSVAVGSLVGGTHTFTNVHFKADGLQTVVEVEFTIPANQCVQTITGPTVQPCSPVCDITVVSLQNAGACNDNGTSSTADDFFTANVVVSFINSPATGALQIEPGGDAITTHFVAVGSLVGGTHTFTNVHFKADGLQTVVEVEFTIPANQCVQTIAGPTVGPCIATPPIVSCPLNLLVTCAGEVPSVNTAAVLETHDCIGDVEVEHIGDVISSQTCANQYTITRTYEVTDECGHSVTCSQIITVNDQVPPTFDSVLVDETYQCLDLQDYSAQELMANDNCGSAIVDFFIETNSADDCGNGLWTVHYTAIDLCGNTATDSYTITVQDTEPPLLGMCDEDMQLPCDAQIPSSAIPTAMDECGGPIGVTMNETYTGNPPEPGSIADCNIKTPVRPTNNPCGYPYDWAMSLFGLPKIHRYYKVENGTFVQYPNGTIVVSADFKNVLSQNNGWHASVTFSNAMSWSEWSTQTFPTNFKADCGGVSANHLDWMYHRLLNTPGVELVGFGGYFNSSLNLKHAPNNLYFGFQLGDGANNYNAAYGFGGWFTYSGTFKVNNTPYGSSTGYISGAGDFAFELDCCPYYEVIRTFVASDCSGNSDQCAQTLTFGTAAMLAPEAPMGNETLYAEGLARVNPNPTTGITWFVFHTKENANTTLELYDMTGKKVADVFAGFLEEDTEYTIDFNAEILTTGIYLYRITNGSSVEQGKLIVNR